MVTVGQRDYTRPESRRYDIQQRGWTRASAPTKKAARIDEGAHEAPTRYHDRLDIAKAATETESLLIAPEATRPKSEDAIAVEIDVQDLPMIITSGNQQQEADPQLLTNIEIRHLANRRTTPRPTQTTL